MPPCHAAHLPCLQKVRYAESVLALMRNTYPRSYARQPHRGWASTPTPNTFMPDKAAKKASRKGACACTGGACTGLLGGLECTPN